jgi:hypothetical protein
MDEKIKKILDDHEKRIMVLEHLLKRAPSVKRHGLSPSKDKQLSRDNYKGLAGGIRFLIDNGFFSEPRAVDVVDAELKREGYHSTLAGISSTLSETFTKSQKILARIKEDNKWKYFLRK